MGVFMLTTQMAPAQNSAVGQFTLQIGSVLSITNEQMSDLRQLNQGLRLERSGQGDLEIADNPSMETHWRTNKLYLLLANWAMDDRSGLVFDSQTCFVLPNGAIRSPDLAWIRKTRLIQYGIKRKRPGFLPMCPDFFIRLRNRQEPLDHLLATMREFVANGASMGWLIDAVNQCVHVYGKNEPELCLENPSSISGEPLLRGFSLHPDRLWVQH